MDCILNCDFTEDPIYEEISKALNLKKFPDENQSKYEYRLFYSAICRYMLKMYNEYRNDPEVKAYYENESLMVARGELRARVAYAVEKMIIENFEKINSPVDFFGVVFDVCDYRAIHFVLLPIIRRLEKIYEDMGYVNVDSLYENDNREIGLGNGLKLVIDSCAKTKTMRGCGLIDEATDVKINLDEYLKCKPNSKEYFGEFLKLADFQLVETCDYERIQYYDYNVKNFVYLNTDYLYDNEYYLVKYDDEDAVIKVDYHKIYMTKICNFILKDGEIIEFKPDLERLHIGIKSYSFLKSKARIIDEKNGTSMICISGFRFPKYEENLVNCISWPRELVNNFAYIVTDDCLDAFKKILDHLDVEYE